MHRKRSMRIFWISLSLLLLCGAIIMACVWVNTDKGQAQANVPNTSAQRQSVPSKAESSDYQAMQENTVTDAQPASQPASGTVQPYQFEIRIAAGYLDVYYYQTDTLYLHTGIPCEMLDVSDQAQLEQGKYFKDEQELYGYLESCTS